MKESLKTPAEIKRQILELAEKLQRIPEKDEFYSNYDAKEWDIRKAFGGWTKALEKSGALKFLDPDLEQLKDLSLKINQLKKENKLLDKQMSSLQDELVTSKKLKSLIFEAKDFKIGKKTNWLTTQSFGKTKGIPILFLSDLHFDEIVSPDQIQGMNKFNREIAVKRLQHTFNTTINLLHNEIKDPFYDGFVLALGGDIFSGNIHEELAETNEASILQSVVALIDILIAGIELLKLKFGKVFIPCVVGNHGRLHRKPRAKNRVFDNYEWILYQFLNRHFSNDPNVVFSIPDGSDCQFQVYNKTVLLTHGDQFRGGNGIAGIFTPLMLGMSRKQKRNASVKRPFDIMLAGHFHQLIMTQYLIVNGTLKGYDEYAFQNNFPYEPAQQALMVIHPIHGITHQMPVLCDGYLNEAKEYNGNKIKAIW